MKMAKILIVEDEVLVALNLVEELKYLGYNVCDFVTSGEEAIKFVLEKNPDLILMDINLSGELNRIDTANQIIANKNIPIAFMTGYHEDALLEKIKSIKSPIFLHKPINIDDIISIIKNIE